MSQQRLELAGWPQAFRQARADDGLTQIDVARLAGLPQGQVSRIENGMVDPRLSSAVRLAWALRLDPMLVPKRARAAVLDILRNFQGEDTSNLSAVDLLIGRGTDGSFVNR